MHSAYTEVSKHFTIFGKAKGNLVTVCGPVLVMFVCGLPRQLLLDPVGKKIVSGYLYHRLCLYTALQGKSERRLHTS